MYLRYNNGLCFCKLLVNMRHCHICSWLVNYVTIANSWKYLHIYFGPQKLYKVREGIISTHYNVNIITTTHNKPCHTKNKLYQMYPRIRIANTLFIFIHVPVTDYRTQLVWICLLWNSQTADTHVPWGSFYGPRQALLCNSIQILISPVSNWWSTRM